MMQRCLDTLDHMEKGASSKTNLGKAEAGISQAQEVMTARARPGGDFVNEYEPHRASSTAPKSDDGETPLPSPVLALTPSRPDLLDDSQLSRPDTSMQGSSGNLMSVLRGLTKLTCL